VGGRTASAKHPSLRFPEVRAAAAALRAVGGLRPPPFSPWRADQGLMDWLDAFFGFQRDNVRNKRVGVSTPGGPWTDE
jgi:callose synthase